MVKITISNNDLLALFRNVETKKIGIHFLKNVYKSQFGYYGAKVDKGYYFVSVSEKTLKELINILEAHPEVGTSAEFLTGLYYQMKQVNKKENENDKLPF